MMKKKMKKVLAASGWGLFFCGYFYLLFTALVFAFLDGARTRADVLQVLLLALFIAAGPLVTIFCQHRKIGRMEKYIEVLEKCADLEKEK